MIMLGERGVQGKDIGDSSAQSGRRPSSVYSSYFKFKEEATS